MFVLCEDKVTPDDANQRGDRGTMKTQLYVNLPVKNLKPSTALLSDFTRIERYFHNFRRHPL